SQQRGYPAVPLLQYGRQDLRREYRAAKPCAPYCTVACAHYTSALDQWRDPQHAPAALPSPQAANASLVQIAGASEREL
ncbi:MAG: hypothetical protein ACRD17_00660, partial [Terriglobales bacterium]